MKADLVMRALLSLGASKLQTQCTGLWVFHIPFTTMNASRGVWSENANEFVPRAVDRAWQCPAAIRAALREERFCNVLRRSKELCGLQA